MRLHTPLCTSMLHWLCIINGLTPWCRRPPIKGGARQGSAEIHTYTIIYLEHPQARIWAWTCSDRFFCLTFEMSPASKFSPGNAFCNYDFQPEWTISPELMFRLKDGPSPKMATIWFQPQISACWRLLERKKKRNNNRKTLHLRWHTEGSP